MDTASGNVPRRGPRSPRDDGAQPAVPHREKTVLSLGEFYAPTPDLTSGPESDASGQDQPDPAIIPPTQRVLQATQSTVTTASQTAGSHSPLSFRHFQEASQLPPAQPSPNQTARVSKRPPRSFRYDGERQPAEPLATGAYVPGDDPPTSTPTSNTVAESTRPQDLQSHSLKATMVKTRRSPKRDTPPSAKTQTRGPTCLPSTVQVSKTPARQFELPRERSFVSNMSLDFLPSVLFSSPPRSIHDVPSPKSLSSDSSPQPKTVANAIYRREKTVAIEQLMPPEQPARYQAALIALRRSQSHKKRRTKVNSHQLKWVDARMQRQANIEVAGGARWDSRMDQLPVEGMGSRTATLISMTPSISAGPPGHQVSIPPKTLQTQRQATVIGIQSSQHPKSRSSFVPGSWRNTTGKNRVEPKVDVLSVHGIKSSKVGFGGTNSSSPESKQDANGLVTPPTDRYVASVPHTYRQSPANFRKAGPDTLRNGSLEPINGSGIPGISSPLTTNAQMNQTSPDTWNSRERLPSNLLGSSGFSSPAKGGDSLMSSFSESSKARPRDRLFNIAQSYGPPTKTNTAAGID